MILDPVWWLAAGFWLCGALCGWAWHHGRIESARADGHADGMREGYMQGRADAITVAKQQEHRTLSELEAAMDAANRRMQK